MMSAMFVPSCSFRDQNLRFLIFVMLMIAGHGGVDIIIFQKNPAMPGVFRRDQIDFLQDAQHPQGDILQVTDGSRA